MERNALQRFVRRDWAPMAASKDRHWRAMKADRSAAGVLAMADGMRVHAQRLRPGWPTAANRLEDVRVHQRVGESLRAVASRPR